jgi:hypothetical protein
MTTAGGSNISPHRSNGPVCVWRGLRCQLGPATLGPFAGRPDLDVVLGGVADLMAMPSAGDLVIYGTDAPGGTVSFIPERGAQTTKNSHGGGPSGWRSAAGSVAAR